MIFGKEYDIALSMILKCDKKNKEEIIKKITELPMELIKQIREAIKIIDEKGIMSELTEEEQTLMSGVVEVSDTEYFAFSIDRYDLSLSITKTKKQSSLVMDSHYYELELSRINDYQLMDMDMFEDEYIGKYETDRDVVEEKTIVFQGQLATSHKIASNESEYYIDETPIGWYICTCFCDKNDKERKKISRINLDKIMAMQDSICVENLDNIFLSKRKVKTRKRI